ncbi:uncharacterized protein B0H18DRAFT_982092 [Fomitopsis serialis]|uniref:uncharacterized protein n=1 Tax=Fomitopsis serialis TaxID=139415 RepID=UPI0020087432|nr:uncharacterized protein B0H18DRAFT_982092 [Neoantrodia serialis]KAH9933799.1 hypothetical protein B0H18DRAFT_982092 [Neoantrodia serialis]
MEICCSSRTLDLPSLDPPGTKRKVRQPFAYTKVKPRYDQVKGYLATAEPFLTLPRLLVPSRRVKYKPPLMHYGWRVSRYLLLDYARANRLTRRWGRDLTNYECMDRALATINKKCGASMSDVILQVQTTLLDGIQPRTFVVSLYTNYELKRIDLPSQDGIERLQRASNFEEPPRWFLDGLEWRWSRWSY